ncbi:hypothetical protein [Weissella cibaria]|uniref:Uncharacterized protein n=1 Tax=Weissella cibaria TaxID=137591 RepID=A0A0D1LH02_9LACO|nr:hypothetical protein [Weissella cibaria]KIU19785.1 hypothetical protein QX99_01806 [Weissella cibaria]MDV8929036.1 hypothetical protein [Weissella cibaria]
MSFNSKMDKEDYLDPESEVQMKEAFANNPVRNMVEDLDLGGQKNKRERKESVSITMTPTMKKALLKIAKQNGYTGMSAFAVDLFQAIIDQQENKKEK